MGKTEEKVAGEGIEPEVIIVRAPGVTTKLIVLSPKLIVLSPSLGIIR